MRRCESFEIRTSLPQDNITRKCLEEPSCISRELPSYYSYLNQSLCQVVKTLLENSSLRQLVEQSHSVEFILNRIKLIVYDLMKSSKDQYIESLLKQLRLANNEIVRLQKEGDDSKQLLLHELKKAKAVIIEQEKEKIQLNDQRVNPQLDIYKEKCSLYASQIKDSQMRYELLKQELIKTQCELSLCRAQLLKIKQVKEAVQIPFQNQYCQQNSASTRAHTPSCSRQVSERFLTSENKSNKSLRGEKQNPELGNSNSKLTIFTQQKSRQQILQEQMIDISRRYEELKNKINFTKKSNRSVDNSHTFRPISNTNLRYDILNSKYNTPIQNRQLKRTSSSSRIKSEDLKLNNITTQSQKSQIQKNHPMKYVYLQKGLQQNKLLLS